MVKSSKLNQIILIMLDDVRASHLFNLVDSGKLPNIAFLAKNGISSRNCVTSYPSITYPCYSNIIIGSYSGYFLEDGSGIPDYHWIDRKDPPIIKKKLPFIRNYSIGTHVFKSGKDLGKNVKTIFEQVGEGNLFSATNVIFRGSKFNAPNEYTSTNIIKDVEDVFRNPSKFFENNEVPKVTACYVPKTDSLMHERGFDDSLYVQEIINTDIAIGKLISTLKSLNYFDSTAIAVISDHGNYKAKSIYDLEPFFENIGMIPYNPKEGGDFDAAIGSVGRFNFRGETWFHHPNTKQLENYKLTKNPEKTVNLFEVLWKIPKTKYMFYPDSDNTPERGKIHLRKKNLDTGEIVKGKIEFEGLGRQMKTSYTYDKEELFGYENSDDAVSLLDGKKYTIEEWLSKTWDIDFPIIIDQLVRYFKNPRSCDIMISNCGEIGFGYEHGKTKSESPFSHDIALRTSMIVPFIIGGSECIPNQTLDYCKTVDMVPTLLELLGLKPDSSVTGKIVI